MGNKGKFDVCWGRGWRKKSSPHIRLGQPKGAWASRNVHLRRQPWIFSPITPRTREVGEGYILPIMTDFRKLVTFQSVPRYWSEIHYWVLPVSMECDVEGLRAKSTVWFLPEELTVYLWKQNECIKQLRRIKGKAIWCPQKNLSGDFSITMSPESRILLGT